MAGTAAELAPGGAEEVEERLSSVSPLGLALRRLLKKRIAMVAIVFIAAFYLMGVSAPILDQVGIIPGYTEQDLENGLQDPTWWPMAESFGNALHPFADGDFGAVSDLIKGSTWSHPMGTDRLGRDQMSRVIWASQTTMIITVSVVVTGGLILTVGLGLLSGYLGGWVDSLIMRVGDIFLALPGLLMLILINATLGDQVEVLARKIEAETGISGIVRSGAQDYFLIAVALSLFSWVGGARVIRSQILSLRETEFVLAARSLGASTPRILFRHLLPNVSNIIIVSVSLGLAGIAGSEIVLTWFGVGIPAAATELRGADLRREQREDGERSPVPARVPGRHRRGVILRLQPAGRRADGRVHAASALAVVRGGFV